MSEDMLFTWYPNISSFEAANNRLFAAYGYNGRAQDDGITTRFFDPIKHPNGPSEGFLGVITEVWHHGEGSRKGAEYLRTTHLTAGERSRIRTKAAWRLEGFFPEDNRPA